MRRIASNAVATCFMMAAVPATQAQTLRPELRSDAPVVTRLVQLYSDYEHRLADAIERRDAGEIDRLLADDFEVRSAAHPGAPIPRAEWIAQAPNEKVDAKSIRQMAVHDYGVIRIVSFVMKSTEERRNRELMVVDVWVQSGESSRLSTRYVAPAGP